MILHSRSFACSPPVSYTHLDVYKRQVFGLLKSSSSSAANDLSSLLTFSLTLDVTLFGFHGPPPALASAEAILSQLPLLVNSFFHLFSKNESLTKEKSTNGEGGI